MVGARIGERVGDAVVGERDGDTVVGDAVGGERDGVERGPRCSQAQLEARIRQTWDGERLELRATPAPKATKPRLVVTLRGEDGLIVDLFRLQPIRFDGTTAVFEADILDEICTRINCS